MIDAIRSKVADGFYEFSKHAVDQSILRNISLGEFLESVENGTTIEDYPEDKYGPSCLILRFTKAGRPLHLQCTSGEREIVKVIHCMNRMKTYGLTSEKGERQTKVRI